jgi:hypothetical protein
MFVLVACKALKARVVASHPRRGQPQIGDVVFDGQ